MPEAGTIRVSVVGGKDTLLRRRRKVTLNPLAMVLAVSCSFMSGVLLFLRMKSPDQPRFCG